MESGLLPYGRQCIDEADIAAVVAVLRGDWLTQGPTVAKFEERIAETTGARYAVAVANGTAALHLACLAAGVRAGDVGITSTITFVASANAIRYCGGEVLFVDVDADTACMSVDSLEQRVAARVAAGRPPRIIVPVDFAGAVADLPAVRRIADTCGALVVEDAAHALGGTYSVAGVDRPAACCDHAHMAILSFHPVKHITTGEGGAITTNDEALYRELLELRTHGITRDPARMERNDGPWYYEQRRLGFNYRLTDIQSALGWSQLGKLAEFVRRRRELAAAYDRAFREPLLARHVRPLGVREGTRSSYHLYVLRVVRREDEPLERVAYRRRMLFESLRGEAIAPQVHYIPVHRQPDFRKQGEPAAVLPRADEYYAGCLSLPIHPGMSASDVDRVVGVISRVVARWE